MWSRKVETQLNILGMFLEYAAIQNNPNANTHAFWGTIFFDGRGCVAWWGLVTYASGGGGGELFLIVFI